MKGGIVILYKDSGISSQGAVNRLKRLLGVKKAGHTGTLDPMATGILPVLVERGVKASEYVISEDKHYRAVLRLGLTTDTEDVWGEVLTEVGEDELPDCEAVGAAARAMLGEITQVPPMYSAIKVNGKKLYELAREGKSIEREPRRVTVFEIESSHLGGRDYSLDVHCSKGTYIRTLCADIGKALGCGGVMAALERTECAGYGKEHAHTLEEIENMTAEEQVALIRPIEEIFVGTEVLRLNAFNERLARCGVELYLHKLGISAEVGKRFMLCDGEGGFFALAEVREFDTGLAVKPIKQFDID